MPFFAPESIAGSICALAARGRVASIKLGGYGDRLCPISAIFLATEKAIKGMTVTEHPVTVGRSYFTFEKGNVPRDVIFRVVGGTIGSLETGTGNSAFTTVGAQSLGLLGEDRLPHLRLCVLRNTGSNSYSSSSVPKGVSGESV